MTSCKRKYCEHSNGKLLDTKTFNKFPLDSCSLFAEFTRCTEENTSLSLHCQWKVRHQKEPYGISVWTLSVQGADRLIEAIDGFIWCFSEGALWLEWLCSATTELVQSLLSFDSVCFVFWMCSCSPSAHRAPDKKAAVPIYKILVRPARESTAPMRTHFPLDHGLVLEAIRLPDSAWVQLVHSAQLDFLNAWRWHAPWHCMRLLLRGAPYCSSARTKILVQV